MPTYNVSLPATTSTPQFVCNVPTNATTVTITQSGGGLWGAGGYYWYPQGSPYPSSGPNPTIAATAVDTDWTTGGQSGPSSWSVYWTGTATPGSTPVPFATIYIAVPSGSGAPATPYHADTLGDWYRPNTGPTAYTVGVSGTPNSQIQGGYDLYIVAVNDAIGTFGDNTGTLTATVDVTVPEPPSVPTLSVVAGCMGGQAYLSWSDSGTVQPVQTWNLWRDGVLLINLPVGTTSYHNIGLVTGTAYSYQISAVGTNGLESDKSTATVVTPCLHPQQGVSWATGGACEGGQASISWAASDSVDGVYLNSGQVTQNVYVGGVLSASGISGNTFSHLIAPLTIGTPVQVQMSLTDPWGNESPKTTAITITPCAVPGNCCSWSSVNTPSAGVWTQVNKPCG